VNDVRAMTATHAATKTSHAATAHREGMELISENQAQEPENGQDSRD
jgi:hypothetical protein